MKKNFGMITRAAEFKPATTDSKQRTVEMVWTTGARVTRNSFWDGPYIEELAVSAQAVDLARLNSGAPVLNSHNQNSLSDVLGVVERAWISGNEGRATVRFSSRPEVDAIWQDVQAGIIRNVSVGYRVDSMEKVGQEGELPVMRVTRWEPFELSVVAVGADPSASFRGGEETYPCEINLEGESMEKTEVVEATLKTEEVIEAEKTEAAEGAPEAEAPVAAAPAVVAEAAPVLDAEAVRKATVEAERARAAEIFEVCRKAKLDAEKARAYIEAGTSAEQVRKEIIDMIATKETIQTARVEAGSQDEMQTRKEGVEAALLHRSSPGLFKLEGKAREYVGMSLLRIAEEFIGNVRGMTRAQIARRALMTSDFAELMSNVAGKTLRRAYDLQPKTFTPFVTMGTLPDYKSQKRVAFGEAPSLLQIAEGDDYQTGTIGEGAESIQLAKFGRVIELSDILIQNDDLSAFSRLSSMYGAAAARLESSLVYGVLTGNPVMADGKAIFHADHGNLASASAIDVAGLNAARKLMRKQKGLDGQDYLDLSPAFLVCGPDKEIEARQIISSQIVPNEINAVNPFANSMQVIVDPRIDGNAWYLIASPTSIDTIEVAMLEGMSGPEVSSEVEFMNDTLRVKAKHVVGTKCIDHKGMVYNPGA